MKKKDLDRLASICEHPMLSALDQVRAIWLLMRDHSESLEHIRVAYGLAKVTQASKFTIMNESTFDNVNELVKLVETQFFLLLEKGST